MFWAHVRTVSEKVLGVVYTKFVYPADQLLPSTNTVMLNSSDDRRVNHKTFYVFCEVSVNWHSLCSYIFSPSPVQQPHWLQIHYLFIFFNIDCCLMILAFTSYPQWSLIRRSSHERGSGAQGVLVVPYVEGKPPPASVEDTPSLFTYVWFLSL